MTENENSTDLLNQVSDKSGLPPGSLIYVGDSNAFPTTISKIEYNMGHYTVNQQINIDEPNLVLNNHSGVTWINLCGLNDIQTIKKIGEYFQIHLLTLEDILNTNQRPKVEIFDNYVYFVVKKIASITDPLHVEYDQMSIIMGQDYVITFEEQKDSHLNKIITRIDKNNGLIRKLGADYLTYAIIDSIVDQYFSLQESIDDLIEELEDELLFSPTSNTLNAIHHLKREIIYFRKAISPISDLINYLLREESDLITEPVKIYFRDVLDHSIRMNESIDTHRELISGMLNIYLSVLSNKTNEVMRILTVFASVFIPLTFVAGIYGMNFDYMPELHWKWAYPVIWVIFIFIIIVLFGFFKKRKWL